MGWIRAKEAMSTIEVALGCVQRPVANFQGVQDAALALLLAHLIDTVAQHGYPDAVL